MIMAKAYQLNEIADCEKSFSGRTPLENAGRNGFEPRKPSAEAKFLNERAIWQKALEVTLLPENSSD